MYKFNYKALIIIIAIMLMLLTLTACPKPIPTPSPEVPASITVLQGVEKLLNAAKATGALVNTSDIIHIDLTGNYSNGEETFDIIFKANIEPTGNPTRNIDNKIYLEIRRSNIVYLGLYYFNDKLYLNLPLEDGLSSEKIFVSNLKLCDIVKLFGGDDESDLLSFKNVIAAFINGVEYSEELGVETIVYSVNIAKAVETMVSLITLEYPDFDIDSLLGMVGLSTTSLIGDSAVYNDSSVTVVIDDGIIKSMAYNSGADIAFGITSLALSSGAGNFTIPINVQQYTEYSPTNFDVSGTISLEFKNGEFINPIAGIDVTSNLIQAKFDFDFRARAIISLLAPANTRVLIELSSPDEWSISLYYDGSTKNIYADLTEINMGKVMMNADSLTELFNSLSSEVTAPSEETTSESELNINIVLSLLGIIAPAINMDIDSIDVELDTDRFRDLFNLFGIVLPLDITEAGANIVRSGYGIDSVNAWIETGGIKLEIVSDSISVGPVPVVPALPGLGSYIDVENVDVFTLFMNGTLDLDTAQEDIKSFIEAALSNISAESIQLSTPYPPIGTTIKYQSKLSINADDGSIDSLTVELYDTLDRYIVGITYLSSSEKIQIVEQFNVSGNMIYVSNEYNLSYDISAFQEIITGINNPAKPTTAASIVISNSLSSLSLSFNYNAFYLITDYLGRVLFNDELIISDDYVFDNISLTIGNGVIGRVEFTNGRSISLTADDISVSYIPVYVTGIQEQTTRNVASVYMDNDMPEVLTLNFSDGSVKKFEVSEWTYNLDGFVNTTGGLVVASTYILGHKVDINLNVTGTSISSLISNVPNDGFAFNKNDVSVDPIALIQSYNQITVRLATRDITKDLYWSLDELEGANANGHYNIQGVIYDFFGRPQYLPSATQYYRVALTGVDIVEHNLSISVDSYSGFDATNINSYPALAILTDEGLITTDSESIGEIVNLEWDLTNIIDAYNQPGFNAYLEGLNINVSVNIPNSLGSPRVFDVNVVINPAVMTGLTFEGSVLGNGMPIDESLNTSATASGISWDSAEQMFVINPMRIRALSEAVLPSSVTMYTNAGTFVFYGLKWEFLPLSILNSGGTYDDILRLVIGDSIGGYQSTFITIKVEMIDINDFEIMNLDEEVITTSNIDTLYKLYPITNPYDYDMPLKTKIYTTIGDFILLTNWSFPTFNTATLFNGGEFEGTYQAGSQQLRVRIQAEPTIAVMTDGLSFGPEDTDIHYDAVRGLVFNPYTSADFTDVSIYPATGLATFSDGEGTERTLSVPLKWNIDAITSLYSSSNPNMYKGKTISVTATTNYPGCGDQQFNVNVYIEEALIDNSRVMFSLDNQTKVLDMSIFGVDGGNLTFIDPRLTDSYPTTIRVAYLGDTLPSRIIPMAPEDVEIGSWSINSITTAYNQASIISGVSGVYNIIATVGTYRGGYQTITMQVNITSAELGNVIFTQIPLLQNGKPSFDYDNTEGAGYIATFTYDPYASNVKNSISYPKSMTFDLDINGVTESFDMNVVWNLNALNNITPYQGGTYIVEARLPLSTTGYIPIPVRLVIQQKIVDTMDGEGLFNIFIDPLDNTPFGRRNTTSQEIRQNVLVTFTDNSDSRILTLAYSRAGIMIDFGGVLYNVQAVVGNEFGGYQPIGLDGEIQAAIIQREITAIHTDDEDNLELFRRDELEVYDEFDNLLYIIISEVNDNILYYESKPETLLFSFTSLDEPISIPLKTQSSTGLCYDWVDVSGGRAELVIYNIIPAFMDGSGNDTVFINNPSVLIDVVELESVNGLLITQGTYGIEYYGGIVDVYAELNGQGKINNAAMGISADKLSYVYYLDGEIIDEDFVRNAGIYTLRIYVKGHTVYGGYDEVLYQIHKLDITDQITIQRGGINLVTGSGLGGHQTNVTESISYNGADVIYTATAEPFYSYTINIVYPDVAPPVDVGEYIIYVEVDSMHLNYICDNVITLTISKIVLDDTSLDITFNYPVSIIYTSDEFITELEAFGTILEDEDYSVRFYSDIDCNEEISDISVLNVGTYYVNVIYVGDNYDIAIVKSFEVIPAIIDVSQYSFTASNLIQGSAIHQLANLNLSIFGVQQDLTGITLSYYEDAACTIEIDDISLALASSELYYLKVVYVYSPNYQPVTAIASFLIIEE